MKILALGVLLLSSLLTLSVGPKIVQGQCVGSGTYADPYVYQSPVDPATGAQFMVKRGQTQNSDQFTIDGILISESMQAQVDERQEKNTHPILGLITTKHTGASLDLESVSTQINQNGWKRTWHKVTEVVGSIVEFQSPTNPPETIGVVKISTLESEMHQDANGTLGDLVVTSAITNPNPNPNNDPLAEDLTFTYAFNFNTDTWNASVDRKVNGEIDCSGTDQGSWSPYGAGTTVNLPDPSLPLAGSKADWYIDGTYADDAWTLSNNVHYHPGPLAFGFQPLQQAYIEQYCP